MNRQTGKWTTWGVAGILMAVFWLSCQTGSALSLPTLAPSDSTPEVEITIQIQNRRFEPGVLQVRVGQKTRLIFKNQDAELHAFVPGGLLSGISFQVSGTGAPEFNLKGLRRVLLPSSGQTDILFVPGQPGVYPFFCDLPGHVMSGSVVVKE